MNIENRCFSCSVDIDASRDELAKLSIRAGMGIEV